MTLEEIWDNITILSDNTIPNPVLFGGCLGIFLTVALLVSTIRVYRQGFGRVPSKPLRIIVFIAQIVFTVLCFWFYTYQPYIIKLQIATNVETVSVEHLAEHFELSDILIGDGQIICDIKPKFDCYNEVLELWRMNSEVLYK